MTVRRIEEKPSFAEVDSVIERDKLLKEILKIKPKVEVSIEGHSEIAKGRIIEWSTTRKLFTVKWDSKSTKFDQATNTQTGLRVFFKALLFSTPLVFKTTTVRHLPDGNYHYRIPQQMFKQQKRGALRVPLSSGKGVLNTREGRFRLLDLSVGGASFKIEKGFKTTRFTACELILDGMRIRTPEFEAQATYVATSHLGVRFSGLNENVKTQIKQFLVEALRAHYGSGW